jgi:branched-chain amino acid aminotransferase
VSSVNGAPIADGKVPGPMTKRLLGAYSELVACDIAGQYLAQLS